MQKEKDKRGSARGNKSGTGERFGLILAIVSMFVTLCLLTRNFILGDLGEVVYCVFTGIFGCFAYPLFILFLIAGIAKARRKQLKAKVGTVIAVVIVSFCVAQILQIATTSAAIQTLSYGEYLKSLYQPITAAGMLGGLTAYPIALAFQPIGSYVLFGVILLVSLLLASEPGRKLFEKNRQNKLKKKISKTKAFEQSEEVGLFIGTVGKKNNSASEISCVDDEAFSSREQEENPNGEMNTHSTIDDYTRTQKDEYWESLMQRRESFRRMVNDEEESMRRFIPKQEDAVAVNGEERQAAYTERPFPQKNYDNDIIEGPILDGDDESRRLAEQNPRFPKAEPPVAQPPINSAAQETGAQREEESFDFSSLPPIIVGESYQSSHTETAPTQAEANEGEAPVVSATENAEAQDQDDIGALAQASDYGYWEEDDAQPPIIDAGSYVSEHEYQTAPETIDVYPREEVSVPEVVADDESAVFMQEEEAFTDRSVDGDAVSVSSVDTEEGDETYLQEEEEPSAVDAEAEDGDTDYEEYDPFVDTEDMPEGAMVFDDEGNDVSVENPYADNDAGDTEEIEPAEGWEEDDIVVMEDEASQSRLIIEDGEAEDLSENRNQTSEAIAQYYSNLNAKPEEQVDLTYKPPVPEVKPQRAKRQEENVLPNQIGMEEYAEAPQEEEKPAPKVLRPYTFPELSMLTCESTPLIVDDEEKREKTALLEQCLESLGIPAKVIGITKGPAITQYELSMPVGMRVSKVESVSSDIKYNLASKYDIRILTPIPGKRAIGIEVPNDSVAMVGLKDIINSEEFRKSSSPLTVALGKDIQGNVIVTKLNKLPHLLIAGTTGSGKSACLNSLIVSLLYKSSPEDVKLILVDPKCVEFTAYNGLPHMLIPNAITDVNQAIKAFSWVRDEMNRRYMVMQEYRCRVIDEYNNHPDVKSKKAPKMPFIVFIVDEYAELMCSTGGSDKKKVLETHITSIAQKARAAGIHLVLATQRPSQDVVTGTLKANLPAKICFKVSSRINSQVVIDKPGAETLVGRGDMLFLDPTVPEPTRVQGAYIDNPEVQEIVDYIKDNNDTDFSAEFKNAISEPEKKEVEEDEEESSSNEGGPLDGYDKDIAAVARLVLKMRNAAGSMIQRRFKMGYVRAVKIVDELEELGCIGPLLPSNKREIYLTPEMFKEIFNEDYE